MLHADDASWQLTLEAVAHYPRPGANVPGSAAFSPDGRLLTYLFSERGGLIRSLWALDTETGERRVLAGPPGEGTTDANVNPEEALRRERQRLREGGITHYSWAKSADRILVPVNGQLYLTSSRGEELQAIAPDDDPAVDARITADGRQVVFVRRGELWVADVEEGEARQLTFDVTSTRTNGLAEYIAQEEMGRSTGFWISPDTTLVAFAQVEEGHIPIYPIVHQGTAAWRVEEHRYPFAGAANAIVRLGVVPLAGGDILWRDLPGGDDMYLARVDWRPDGMLAVQVETRDQSTLDLYLLSPNGGEARLLLSEQTTPWVNLHNDLRFLAGNRFLWSSERTGFRHLYRYEADGTLPQALTTGDWAIDQIAHLDEERGAVYATGTRDDARERQVYRIALDGSGVERLTEGAGFHGAMFGGDGSAYLESFENRSQPPRQTLRFREPARASLVVHETVGNQIDSLRPPEFVELAGADGTPLFGALYRPATGSGPFPLIVSVYGGPHAQMVTDTWGMTVDLRAQYLASLGFAVFKLDNRGAARRGLAFEGALHRQMGTVEIADQVAGVRWLAAQGIADPSRVGIYGWSYGGYLTLMALLTAPDVFHVGVAGAPVVDWDGYDTHYTERYMGTPATNPTGYHAGSALTHAGNLRGKLLLVHGMIDENVHFRHSARLITALQAADRPFDLLLFPGERHMPRDEQGRTYLERRVADYFVEHLLP